jgi:hypothetical protein
MEFSADTSSLAPMPRASVRTATAVKPGFFASIRSGSSIASSSWSNNLGGSTLLVISPRKWISVVFTLVSKSRLANEQFRHSAKQVWNAIRLAFPKLPVLSPAFGDFFF